MQKKLAILAALSIAGLAACGGSSPSNVDTGGMNGGNTPSLPQLAASAAPNYDFAYMNMDSTDASVPAPYVPAVAPAATAEVVTVTTSGADPVCHPALFVRTHEIVARFNRHSWKALQHVEALIKKTPKLTTGTTVTWSDSVTFENVQIVRQFTMTEVSTGDYTFDLSLGTSASSLVTIFSGTIDNTSAAPLTTIQGTLAYNFDALHSVIPTELASGSFTATTTVVKDSSRPSGQQTEKTIVVKLVDFLPEEGDPHGPRSGTYTHLSQQGVGGYLDYGDTLQLLCPNVSPATPPESDLSTYTQWYLKSGVLSGRADSYAVNENPTPSGQIPQGDEFVGVSCYSDSTVVAANATSENLYWLMKEENIASGQTLRFWEAAAGTATCDPAFGPTPSSQNNTNDFNFSNLPNPAFPNEVATW